MEVLSHKAVLDQFQMIMHQHPVYSKDSEYLASLTTSLPTLFVLVLASNTDAVFHLCWSDCRCILTYCFFFFLLCRTVPSSHPSNGCLNLFPTRKGTKGEFNSSLCHTPVIVSSLTTQVINTSRLPHRSLLPSLSVLSNDISVWQTGSQTDR